VSAQDRPGLPKELLLEMIDKDLIATVIGPVEIVDS
jgi:hypothetical protein